MQLMIRFALLMLLALVLGACAHADRKGADAPIHHVVLLKLRDPADASALVADCHRLREIEGVLTLRCGRPAGIPGPNIDSDFDAALTVVFAGAEDYAAYDAHPLHQELVRRWMPRLEWLRIHDFREDSPLAVH